MILGVGMNYIQWRCRDYSPLIARVSEAVLKITSRPTNAKSHKLLFHVLSPWLVYKDSYNTNQEKIFFNYQKSKRKSVLCGAWLFLGGAG